MKSPLTVVGRLAGAALFLLSPVVCQTPDLEVVAGTVTKGTWWQGGSSVAVTTTVRNTGNGKAPASHTTFFLTVVCCGRAQRPDCYLASQAVPALDPGKEFTATTNVQMPWSRASISTRFFIAWADGLAAVSESDEKNGFGLGSHGWQNFTKGPGRWVNVSHTATTPCDPKAGYHPASVLVAANRGANFRFHLRAPNWRGHWYLTLWSRSRTPFVYDDLGALTSGLVNSPLRIAVFGRIPVPTSLPAATAFQVAVPPLPGVSLRFFTHTLWFAPDFSKFEGTGENVISWRIVAD